MHEIPEDALNSNIEYCIEEYVRNEIHREMLRDKWFRGKSLEQIAEKYQFSVTTVKKVIYDTGDKILLRASTIKPQKANILLWIFSKVFDLAKINK